MDEIASWDEAEEEEVRAEVLDTLSARFSAVPRAHVALAIDAMWPRMDQIEATLVALDAEHTHKLLPSLDFTRVRHSPSSTTAHPR